MRHARALLTAAVPSIVATAFAGAYGCGSDGPGDGGTPTSTCASFAGAVPSSESLGSGVLRGADVDGSFCARVKVRSGSYQHASPSDLVLELSGIDGSFTHTKPLTVGGDLNGYIGLNTASAGTSASTDPGQCGTIFTRVLLAPSPNDHHCEEDAGQPSGCPTNCFRTCSGDNGCDGIPCQPIPEAITYEAALSGNCLGVITTPVGGWKVTLTSLEPNGRNPHGTIEGTLIERGDAGTPATITVTF